MGSQRPWMPASQRDTIESVVQSEILPELFAQLGRQHAARAAAAPPAGAERTALGRLSASHHLPERGHDLPSR